MGRCYDFGVSIDTSSERAMVVSAEGGSCVCPSSGVTCTGRFAGCADILNEPGRVPSNAPSWSLDPSPAVQQPKPANRTIAPSAPATPVPVPTPSFGEDRNGTPQPTAATTPHTSPSSWSGGALGDALAAAEQRLAGPPPAQALSALVTAVEQLRHDFESFRTQPHGVSVDDLAEAVVVLRNSTPTDGPVGGSNHQAEMHQLRSDVTQMNEQMNVSLQRLGRAVLELRDTASEKPAGAAPGTADLTAAFEAGQAQATASFNELRTQLVGAADAQAREVHALRAQVTALVTRIEARREADVSGTHIVAELESLRSELSRQSNDAAEMGTASELAATINTLRDAGTEQISAAHLIHSFQLEMRNLRTDLNDIRSAIAQRDAHEVSA